jgi:hypothetical protein
MGNICEGSLQCPLLPICYFFQLISFFTVLKLAIIFVRLSWGKINLIAYPYAIGVLPP